MKKFVKKLPLVAFVFALVAAFAFNMPEEEALATQWFELDDNGNIGEYMESVTPCDGTTNNCAVGLSESHLDEYGDPLYSNISQVPGTVPVEKKN